jgi:hypothetical protein
MTKIRAKDHIGAQMAKLHKKTIEQTINLSFIPN